MVSRPVPRQPSERSAGRTLGRSVLLAATLALAAGASVVGCGGSREGEGGEAGCLSNRRYFEQKIWSAFMQKNCGQCHLPDGQAVAEQNSKFILQPSSYPGFIDQNLKTIQEIASIESGGQSELLRKPLGQMNHGGGVRLDEGSAEFAALKELVSRVQSGKEACSDPGSNVLAGAEMLSAEATLRKAYLDLAGRLPTEEEYAKVRGKGDAELDAALDGLWSEPVFYDRLGEIWNDVMLTDKYLEYGGAAINFMEEDLYPGLLPYKDGNSPEYKDAAKRTAVNTAIARESINIIKYVVKSDKPFTEIVTADYAVVNPFLAVAYGVKPNFQNPNDPNEFVEAKVVTAKGVPVPHAGILSTPVFLNRWNTTPTNRNRARARRVFSFFLATDVLKIAERPIDATKVTEMDNPTRESPYCNTCHRVIDPVAGDFRGWDEFNYEVFDPSDKWHDEMYKPGYGTTPLPPDNYKNAIQWLGQQVAGDPRFGINAVQVMFTGLTGHKPTSFPDEPNAANYAQRLAAWETEDAFIRKTTAEWEKGGKNLKSIIKTVIKSPYYRATALPAPDPTAHASVGTAKHLSPEMLTRKIKAIFGVGWIKQYEFENDHNWLREDYELIYGGIDSDNVPVRLTEPNGITSSVGWRMANEMACHVTAYDFTKEVSERRLFTDAGLSDVPESSGNSVPGSISKIKQNIVKLHDLVLGEKLDVNDPEIERTYQVFYGTWKELNDTKAKPNLYWECQGRIDPNTGKDIDDSKKIDDDPNYTIRAWQAVIAYLILDYKFLYH